MRVRTGAGILPGEMSAAAGEVSLAAEDAVMGVTSR